MDYKKIIKNKSLRLAILNTLSFVPDELMLKIQYRIKIGRKLNLKTPQRYTEKVQWYKLYYRDSLMKKCVDKYEVREYIESVGLGNILNECYGVYENVDDIDFDNLPNQFVLKDTLAGGSTSVIICEDKSSANLDEYKNKMRKWLESDTKCNYGREWVYDNQKHRIICDKYIDSSSTNGLIDYKFFCFNGKVSHLIVISDRFTSEKLDLYDCEWNRMSVFQSDCPNQSRNNLPKPKNFESMISMAQKLSKGFPHVRVDFYNIDGNIIFGELTFFSGSGYYIFTPDSFDFELGQQFVLPERNN